MEKLSYEELMQMLADAQQLVQPGTKWQHYKGGEYIVKDLVITEETNAVAIVYTPLLHVQVSFVRPLAVWLETVEWNGASVSRFAQI